MAVEETNIGEAVTEEAVKSTQEGKTFTQEEVDNMIARMKGTLKDKLLRPYADLGDPEELRQIKTAYEQKQQDEQVKRGEFEKVLQDLASKKDSEIQKRDNIIKEYKINTPLLNAAAKYKSVNPEQVQSLLTKFVNLNADGVVEVLDSKGAVRYQDDGTIFAVDNLVQEFLNTNPHFVQPTPSTTNTKSSIVNNGSVELDVTKLDMSNPKDRARYKEYKKANGLS